MLYKRRDKQMNKQLTTYGSDGRWHIARPSHYKKEYHGNGENAWYGQTDVINGHKIEYQSKRYSYRWHKMIVLLDGKQLKTSKDYRMAEDVINDTVLDY
jgi:hypothetical protein